MEYRADTPADLAPAAQALIVSSTERPIILLDAEMGMGKTTLVKSILEQLGHSHTSSPTFSIVNSYETAEGPWYHFDLYRIQDVEELSQIGFTTYLDSGRPCLIEWPELALPFIDGPYTRVQITLPEGEARELTISHLDG